MLPFSYQVKRINIGGVVGILVFFHTEIPAKNHGGWKPTSGGGDQLSRESANSATTRIALDKWKWIQAVNLLESTFQEVLTVVESGGGGGGNSWT